MIFRASILVVASVAAAFVVSPVNSKRLKKQNGILSVCSSSQEMDMEEGKEEEESEGDNDKNVEKALKPKLRNCEKLQFDRENMLGKKKLQHSQNLIKELENKRVNLEGKLFKLYSRKEKLSSIALLGRNLDDKTAEIDELKFRICALKVEIKDIQEVIRQGKLAKKQLEMAKKMIGEMQMKDGNASQIKGQIGVLEEQLAGFTADESSARHAMVKKKLEEVKSIELEAVEMKRRNKELEFEKRELSLKLFAAHAKISALADMTESKTVARISKLRHANADLSKEVERLQKSRFDMVEEIVYQRWLNACLRAEIREHQGSTRKVVQNELQKTSDQKLCKITTQNPDMNSSPSSFTSSTESEDVESSTSESSSSGQRSISKDSGIGHNRSCGNIMDGSSVVLSPDKFLIGSPLERTGFRDVDSTSMVPSKTPVLNTELYGKFSKKKVLLQPDFTETSERANLTKVRRVSFNDAVEAVPSSNQVLVNFIEGVFDDIDNPTLVSRYRSRMKAGLQSQSALSGEKHEFPSSEVFLPKPDQSTDSKRRSIGNDELHSSISNVVPNENKMEAHIMPTVFAFLVLLFAVLVCFLHISARIS